jgi:hypothetical protein
MAFIFRLFYMLKASAIYYSVYSLWISAIAFLTAVAHYITVSEGISKSVT